MEAIILLLRLMERSRISLLGSLKWRPPTMFITHRLLIRVPEFVLRIHRPTLDKMRGYVIQFSQADVMEDFAITYIGQRLRTEDRVSYTV